MWTFLKRIIKNYNDLLLIKRIGNSLIIYSHLQIIFVFISYKQLEYNLNSPLFPSHFSCEIFGDYIDVAIITSILFLIMLVFKVFQKNFWVLVFGVFNILIYNTASLLF